MFLQSSFTEIDSILANRQPLYIQNKFQRAGVLGVVTITYPTMEGQKFFNVPATGMAFDICQFVDPESLRNSDSFRKLLNKGVISVVQNTAEAKKALSDPENREIFRAAYEDANNTYSARSDEARKEQAAGAAIRAEKQREQSGAMRNILSSLDPTIARAMNFVTESGLPPDPKFTPVKHPRLLSLESRIASVSPAEVMRELRLLAGALTAADLQAITSNAQWPYEARTWAASRIQQTSAPAAS